METATSYSHKQLQSQKHRKDAALMLIWWEEAERISPGRKSLTRFGGSRDVKNEEGNGISKRSEAQKLIKSKQH